MPRKHKIRMGALYGKNLRHTSFWLDPWAHETLKNLSLRGQMSQSMLINAAILRMYLESLPEEKRLSDKAQKYQTFISFVLHRLR